MTVDLTQCLADKGVSSPAPGTPPNVELEADAPRASGHANQRVFFTFVGWARAVPGVPRQAGHAGPGRTRSGDGETGVMLLRRRAPGIENRPTTTTSQEFEHLDQGWIAVVRWLNANGVDYVLVGAVAEAIRGRREARGPVAIVPAPYRRNYDCLERALWAAHARQRLDHALDPDPDTVPVKVTAEKLARGQRWTLRCGAHDLDIEPLRTGDTDEGPGYQELLYEAARFTLAEGVTVEVASPEDIEHYAQRSRTGVAPTVKIMRGAELPQPAGS